MLTLAIPKPGTIHGGNDSASDAIDGYDRIRAMFDARDKVRRATEDHAEACRVVTDAYDRREAAKKQLADATNAAAEVMRSADFQAVEFIHDRQEYVVAYVRGQLEILTRGDVFLLGDSNGDGDPTSVIDNPAVGVVELQAVS